MPEKKLTTQIARFHVRLQYCFVDCSVDPGLVKNNRSSVKKCAGVHFVPSFENREQIFLSFQSATVGLTEISWGEFL